jgi:hypothetical protein
MHRHHVAYGFTGLAATALLMVSLTGLTPSTAFAQADQTGKTLAQTLVEAAQAAHPEADEIGILVTTSKGCVGIASTDKSDIGEECEAEDIVPMKTGKLSVDKEGTGFDVSVLLHDAAGNTVGVLAVGFKGAPGRTESSVTESTMKIEAEMAARIASKDKLLARSE